jgi:hypothetical protein
MMPAISKNNKVRFAIVFALCLAAAPIALQADTDTFGYTSSSAVAFSYVDVASTGTSVLANSDDATSTISLPFSFRFYGIGYTSLCISTNGLLSFGSCVANDFTNLDLTVQSPAGNQPLIAPFWSDLTFSVPGAGSAVYQTLGTSPTRQFVIQWNNATVLNISGNLNFQAILYEGSNNILFQYQAVQSSSAAVSNGAGATVGIRNTDGQNNGNRLQWSYDVAALANNTAILFTAPAAAQVSDVTSKMKVTTSAFTLNRSTNLYAGTITVTNTSTSSVDRPLTVVLTNISAGVTAVNASGVQPGQGYFYTLPGSDPLTPGQAANFAVQFTNPSNARINFVPKVYSGSF